MVKERKGTIASVLAGTLALCCLVGIGGLGASTRNAMQESMHRAVRIAELRGTIAYLDEYLTMSARVAALSGDERWIRRYNEAEPRLDAAIDEAVALATPDVAVALARTTDDANRRLVELERASFAYVRKGDRNAAWKLLDGQEYTNLKGIYAEGIQTFGKDLTALALAHAASLHRRAWLEACGLLLGGAILFIATLIAFRNGARLRQALAHTEAVARHDTLTDLPNRLKFREHMDHVLNRLHGEGCQGALLYLDLDGFKGVNDTFGHAAGDELLCAVAARLLDHTCGGDLVARLGGDEFAIVLMDIRHAGVVAALSDRLVNVMQEPFKVRGNLVSIGTSIGIATADRTTVSIDQLLHDADIALYQAKAEGRGRWQIFTPEMDEIISRRRKLESALKCALTEQEFKLYYQPLVDARTLEITGFEALLRWQHPEYGIVSPSVFIPIAEEIGLIVDIGAWVLKRACADAAAWPEHIGVAINLSATEFMKGEPVRQVEQALAASGLRAERLQIEITESVLLQDSQETLAVLHRLRDLGAQIAMDDFGTGYSSLSYLRRFPFNKVKIDQSFINGIGNEPNCIEIVRAIVSLGKALGIKILVEGVETAEQLALLKSENCDEYQGYLFGKPKPIHDVQQLIGIFQDTREHQGKPVMV